MSLSEDCPLLAQQPETVGRLIDSPLAEAGDLGKLMPDSPHATSVCLPMWQDVVDYEEGQARVVDQLQGGYPRFVYNACVQQACHVAAELLHVPEGKQVQLYGCQAAAQRAAMAIERWRDQAASDQPTVHPLAEGVVALVHAAPDAAKAVWQHGGEGITSRQAMAFLQSQGVMLHAASPEPSVLILPSQDEAKANEQTLKQRVADMAGAPVDHVFLYPTGMAAIFAIYRVVTQRPGAEGLPTAQFGFPYVDALKVQEHLGPALWSATTKAKRPHKQDCLFYPTGDLQALTSELHDQGQIAGLFCEFPSNPLLVCPDLKGLNALAQDMGFPILVDDTVACTPNVDLLPWTDALTMSLTKYFVGSGDATGGAVVVSPDRPMAAELLAGLRADEAPAPHPLDVAALLDRSEDLPSRLAQINATAMAVADHLDAHPAVTKVHRPDPKAIGWRRTADGQPVGMGGLLSFEVAEPETNAPKVYDAVQLCKGPNLGTSFTLCGAYTLLAHYNELDFVEACGVSAHLIRLSIGLEPAEVLIQRLDAALNQAVLDSASDDVG